jgi:dethiobiotin synthetase
LRLFVTGTDTDAGKTVFSSALAGALKARYWKPIQAGTADGTDSDTVRDLSGLAPSMIIPEGFRLSTPCSPHRAAELDGIEIDCDTFCPPDVDPLVVEGAGGLMVPVTRDVLIIDLVERWRLPVVLVARTSLGTINHSLLSLQALRSRNIPIVGIAFVGDPAPDSEAIICSLGPARRLGRLPWLRDLDRESLAKAFIENFSLEDFR